MQSNSPTSQKMNYLEMSRLEVANVILISRSDLRKSQFLIAAQRVDTSMESQFPQSQNKDRIEMARDLAEQLGDPNPHMTAVRMRYFYLQKSANNDLPDNDDLNSIKEISRHVTENNTQR